MTSKERCDKGGRMYRIQNDGEQKQGLKATNGSEGIFSMHAQAVSSNISAFSLFLRVSCNKKGDESLLVIRASPSE